MGTHLRIFTFKYPWGGLLVMVGGPMLRQPVGARVSPTRSIEVTPEGTQKGIDRHVTVRALPRGEVQQILLLMRFLDSSHCVRVPPPFGQVISE